MSLVLTAALILPIQAHTQTEWDQWQSDWLDQVEALGWTLSLDLTEEWAEMHRRHPEIFDTETVTVLPTREAAAPPPSGMGSDVEQWRSLVAAYSGWDVDRMLRIMSCESGGNPTAYNPSTGVAGLFQIHPLWQKPWPGDYFDPWTNVAVAYQVWLEQGYGAWVCRG